MNKEARQKLKSIERKNRLRRVFLECHGWTRDPQAKQDQWIWCEPCGDWRRVQKVVE